MRLLRKEIYFVIMNLSSLCSIITSYIAWLHHKHYYDSELQVNSTQMEARILLRRTASRVPNLNKYFLKYFRSNHDVTVLCDSSHSQRYVTKYATKSGRYDELLNETINFLSQRRMDLLPPNMKHVLSDLVLADCSHRAFVSKVYIVTVICFVLHYDFNVSSTISICRKILCLFIFQ